MKESITSGRHWPLPSLALLGRSTRHISGCKWSWCQGTLGSIPCLQVLREQVSRRPERKRCAGSQLESRFTGAVSACGGKASFFSVDPTHGSLGLYGWLQIWLTVLILCLNDSTARSLGPQCLNDSTACSLGLHLSLPKTTQKTKTCYLPF